MKSLYAVAGQMSLNLFNYVVFIFLTATLSTVDFVSFSTAVGLNMLAYAIAEGGISYIAPKLLANRDEHSSKIASAFVLIGLSLYIFSLIIGYFLWNSFSTESLNLDWVIAYAVFFISILLLPSWLICWNITLFDVVLMSVVRGITVLLIILYPQPNTFIFAGLFFFIFSIWFLNWLNKDNKVIGFTNKQSLFSAIYNLKEVFFSKTISFAVYSAIPLIVGVAYGNLSASYYVVGERIKALYGSLLQPFIQTIYLKIFQNKQDDNNKKLFFIIGLIINVVMLSIALLILKLELVDLGNNFTNVQFKHLYVIAAFLATTSSLLLYFYILPMGKYYIFRKATYVYTMMLALMFFVINMSIFIPQVWLLLGGEIVFIISLLLFYKGFKK